MYIGGVIVDVVEVSAPGAPEAEGSEDEPPPGGGVPLYGRNTFEMLAILVMLPYTFDRQSI